MQALGRVLAGPVAKPAWDDYWYQPRGQDVDGITVTDARAMSIAAFYAGMTAISEDIAKAPFGVYEDLGDKGRRPARNHPVHDLIHFRPNEDQTSLEWREMIVAFALLRGLAVSEIVPGPRGVVDRIVPLHPDLVTERATDRGDRFFEYRDPRLGMRARRLLPDDVHVLRGRFGRSVLDFARSQVVLDHAMQTQQRFLFSRGARFQGALTHPKTLSPGGRTNLRRSLDEYAVTGVNSGRPLLLEEGMTWQNVSLTNRDAETLETHRFTISQWARFFRIPAHKLQDLTRSTNNNIEQQSTDYVTDSLVGWAVRLEQTTRRDLFTIRDRYFTKLNLDGQMRGDIKSRYEAYSLAINAGWLAPNEARAKEDLNPLPGLDEPLSPLNMTPSGQRDQQAVTGYLRLYASDAASRVVRREAAAVARIAERMGARGPAFAAEVAEFYAGHVAHVSQALHIPEHVARRYVHEQQAAAADGRTDDEWMTDRVGALTDIAMNEHYPTEAAA